MTFWISFRVLEFSNRLAYFYLIIFDNGSQLSLNPDENVYFSSLTTYSERIILKIYILKMTCYIFKIRPEIEFRKILSGDKFKLNATK